ncbi:MAG: methionyl-tRNA formyltransferase [Thermoleophilia bacterium]
MRLAFAGTAPLAATVLAGLVASSHQVVCVITTPDKPRGRHGTPQPSPVKVAARELGLPVQQPERPGERGALADLLAQSPDILVACAYGRIVGAPLLAALPVIVVHPSSVPHWRGAAPVVRALMAGEKRIGVATLRMVAAVDAGPVGDLRWLDVPVDADAGAVYEQIAPLAVESMLATLAAVEDGSIVWRPQIGEPTYAAKVVEADRRIDWQRPASAIVNQIRALSPQIGAVTELGGRRLLVWRAAAATQLPEQQKQRLFVAAGTGFVEILDLQPAGGRRMAAAEYLRGTGRSLASQ